MTSSATLILLPLAHPTNIRSRHNLSEAHEQHVSTLMCTQYPNPNLVCAKHTGTYTLINPTGTTFHARHGRPGLNPNLNWYRLNIGLARTFTRAYIIGNTVRLPVHTGTNRPKRFLFPFSFSTVLPTWAVCEIPSSHCTLCHHDWHTRHIITALDTPS